jgi:YidC/Oxa1 family membrane protein insertase
MERRLVLAIVLMIAVMLLSNLLFPPIEAPDAGRTGADTMAVVQREDTVGLVPPAGGTPPDTGRAFVPADTVDALPAEVSVDQDQEVPGTGAATEVAAEAPSSDTVRVRTPLFELAFDTRGATLVSAQLPNYLSYSPTVEDQQPVDLIRRGDRLFGHRIAVGGDTLDLRDAVFGSDRESVELTAASGPDSVSFRHSVPNTPLSLIVTYRFRPDTYLFEVTGRFEGIGGRGYTVLTSLGRGLRSNEANESEDLTEMSWAALNRGRDVATGRLERVDPDDLTAVEGGPFRWVATKNKYFLVAYLTRPPDPGFGGLLVSGNTEESSAEMRAALPVPAGAPSFQFDVFLGPQDYGRLRAAGEDLQNVNPFGWRWLQPVIRPLAGLIIAILVWMRDFFGLAYGWVLILFGVLTRIVLFPLYQKSMRAQMSQMQVQPLIKQMQEKHKDEPQKMQQEMMKLYKEHNINPLAGCLPMLLPFPILITLFFVFRNTIEFRGVPFLWLPDLSLKDPIYIVPFLMGASMLLLNWIGQRGMETNAQMKMMTYAMPVVFTFLFASFPAGLNLYYATSNIASLPQQVYLSRERRKARAAAPSIEPKSGGSPKSGPRKRKKPT